MDLTNLQRDGSGDELIHAAAQGSRCIARNLCFQNAPGRTANIIPPPKLAELPLNEQPTIWKLELTWLLIRRQKTTAELFAIATFLMMQEFKDVKYIPPP